MQRMAWVSVLILASCGGGQGAKSADDEKSSLDDSPAMKCLEEAQIERKAPVDAPQRMDLGQILVRHAGVKDSADVTRTEEEACLRAQEARKKLLGGADWDEVRKEYSDEKGATDGVLFGVAQGDLHPAFAAAAFSLQVDELSYVVETPRGFHVIWRKK
jgi:parvulin-like peptidyl-prolyl isomerase